MIKYKVNDKGLKAHIFISFVNKVWKGDYELVLPEYQKHGIESKLLQLAKEVSPTMLYFGAQPGVESFYEKNGCEKSLQSYIIEKDKFNKS